MMYDALLFLNIQVGRRHIRRYMGKQVVVETLGFPRKSCIDNNAF